MNRVGTALTGRRGLFIVGIVVVLGLIISLAPATNTQQRGSTYGRSPADYGAWYAYMETQGADIHRWRQPIPNLLEQAGSTSPAPTAAQSESSESATANAGKSEQDAIVSAANVGESAPQTLIQIYPELQAWWETSELLNWLEAGHHLIILGLRTPATAAPFQATLTAPAQNLNAIQVATRRRANRLLAIHHETPILQDSYGAIAWEQVGGDRPGHLTLINTPTLAANAYQNNPDNFAFLAAIAQRAGGSIWVDEYLHGYQDQDAATPAASRSENFSWLSYLGTTPLRLVLIQVVLITLIAIAALNRRFGTARTWALPRRNNNAEYIQALAQVLRKADSLTFVRDTIGREERRQLQQALGLGQKSVDDDALRQTWAEQTGRSATELAPYFFPPDRRRLDEATLMAWVVTLQQLRQYLTSSAP